MPPNEQYFDSFTIGPRTIGESPLFRSIRPLFDAIRLPYSITTKSIDLVFLNPSLDHKSFLRDSLLAIVAKKLCGKPIFVFIHGWDHDFYKKVKGSWWLRFLYNMGFKTADHTVVLASSFKDDLMALGADTSRVSILPTMFLKEEVPEYFVERWKVGSPINFLFLSRLVKEKGIFEVLHALARLKDEFNDIHLHVAGNGPAEDEAKILAKKLLLDDVITFHGYVKSDSKKELLARASIFVFPTYYGEGCPVSLLEAMAAGLPVITADAGGIKDIFNAECGELLDTVNNDTVYYSMKKMIMRKEELNIISRHNAEYAGNNFEREKISARIIDLCRRTLN
ncbi:glycosyltransferase family 4 protein [bacterium]|nr:glycosyltransferase family 4 protein [bacterium]